MFSKLLTILGVLLVAALLTVRSVPIDNADDKTSTTTISTDSLPLSIRSSTPVPGQSNPQKSGSEVLKSVTDRVRRDTPSSTTPIPSQSNPNKSDSDDIDSTPGKVRRLAQSPSTPAPSQSNLQKDSSDVVKPVSAKVKRDTPSSTTSASSQSTTASTPGFPLKSGADVLTPVRTGCINKRQASNPSTPSPNQNNPQRSGSDVLKPIPTKVRRETQTVSPTPIPSQSNPLKSGTDVLTSVTSVSPRTRRDTTSTTSAKPPANVASQKVGAEKPKVTREVTTAKPRTATEKIGEKPLW